MPKAKDFSKIGNSAVSKFLSNTSHTDNELTDGQLEINPTSQDEKVQKQTNINTDNIHIEYNVQHTQNTQQTDSTTKEIKSKRLNLLIQPSLLENIKKIAYINKLSVNELIVRLLKDYTDQADQQNKIKKYDEL